MANCAVAGLDLGKSKPVAAAVLDRQGKRAETLFVRFRALENMRQHNQAATVSVSNRFFRAARLFDDTAKAEPDSILVVSSRSSEAKNRTTCGLGAQRKPAMQKSGTTSFYPYWTTEDLIRRAFLLFNLSGNYLGPPGTLPHDFAFPYHYAHNAMAAAPVQLAEWDYHFLETAPVLETYAANPDFYIAGNKPAAGYCGRAALSLIENSVYTSPLSFARKLSSGGSIIGPSLR